MGRNHHGRGLRRVRAAVDHLEAQREDLPAHFRRRGALAVTALGVKSNLTTRSLGGCKNVAGEK